MQKTSIKRTTQAYYTIQTLWAIYGHHYGINMSQRTLGATRGQIEYWTKKVFFSLCFEN